MRLHRLLQAMLLYATWSIASALAEHSAWEPMRFEAETCTEPTDAWVSNRNVPGKWNLWSTDAASHNWSGGVVLQALPVEADRASPEEGAAALHTVIRNLPAGLYDVEVKVARTVAVSLEGKTWRPFTGGVLQRRVRIEGTYELWIDDRYAHVPPGPCYYDCVILHPVPPIENGLYNPGFDLGPQDRPIGWQFGHDGKGKVEIVQSDRPDARRCLRLSHEGERDLYTGGMAWSLRNLAALPVQPGQSVVLRAWIKARRNPMLMMMVEGWSDGKRIARGVGSAHASGRHDWKEVTTAFPVPEGIDALVLNVRGKEAAELWLDDVSLTLGTLPQPKRIEVAGWASKRVRERLDRGLVALPCPEGVYVSWRLLDTDPTEAAFDVYRQTGDASPQRLNRAPIRRTTDFMDTQPGQGKAAYTVSLRSQPDKVSRAAVPGERIRHISCVRVPLQGDLKASKLGIGDLDGDGRYDYVVKHPGHVVWCWNQSGPSRWNPSPDTYKFEAYTADGHRLWRRDLGWAIELGLWYSPFLVHDLDGDGRAEVAVKIGEGDPRNTEGRVVSGPEWVAIWDGLTGREIARAPWPARTGFASYDTMCRHFLSVAYLDGRTPCLLVQRGNYARVIVDAYQFRSRRLERLWRYDNQDYGSRFWGQGAHYTQIGDLDRDGRDEIVLGCAALDDDGTPLWSVGKGHPDYVFLGEVNPARPGWEVFLGIEPRQQRGGNILVDALTGKTIWELQTPTNHVGIDGMCSDIDPTSPGLESQALDVNREKRPAQCWLWSADGRVLRESTRSIGSARTAYWDADLQREIAGSVVRDFDGSPFPGRIEGSVIMIADLLGDWREEIVTSVEGELRIYSTTIPATDRRVCLVRDPLYRNGVALWSMGYPQVQMTSTCLEADSPGLNLAAQRGKAGQAQCRVVVSAPLDRGVKGRLTLFADNGKLDPNAADIALKPGERRVLNVTVAGVSPARPCVRIHARLVGDGLLLTGRVALQDKRLLIGPGMAEAEDIAAQGGGAVHIRDAKDKPGVHAARCFSHWFNKGHWIEWRLKAPSGRYHLLWRYSCTSRAVRSLAVNGQTYPNQRFEGTGGFGSRPEDWDNAIARDAEGNALVFQTDGAPVTVRMKADGGDVGLNLDYLTLLPER